MDYLSVELNEGEQGEIAVGNPVQKVSDIRCASSRQTHPSIHLSIVVQLSTVEPNFTIT
jgi:hypothetical protein